MPLTDKGQKIMASMKKTYGNKAEKVFYASANAGRIKGVEPKAGILRKKKKQTGGSGVMSGSDGGIGGR
jgi:hypothetical protein